MVSAVVYGHLSLEGFLSHTGLDRVKGPLLNISSLLSNHQTFAVIEYGTLTGSTEAEN